MFFRLLIRLLRKSNVPVWQRCAVRCWHRCSAWTCTWAHNLSWHHTEWLPSHDSGMQCRLSPSSKSLCRWYFSKAQLEANTGGIITGFAIPINFLFNTSLGDNHIDFYSSPPASPFKQRFPWDGDSTNVAQTHTSLRTTAINTCTIYSTYISEPSLLKAQRS